MIFHGRYKRVSVFKLIKLFRLLSCLNHLLLCSPNFLVKFLLLLHSLLSGTHLCHFLLLRLSLQGLFMPFLQIFIRSFSSAITAYVCYRRLLPCIRQLSSWSPSLSWIITSILSQFFLELSPPIVFLFSVSINNLVQTADFVLLSGQNFLSLSLLQIEWIELVFQFGLSGIVFVLHGKDVFIDGNFVLQKIVQLVDTLPLQNLLVLQQLQLIFEVLYLLLQTLH